MHYRTSDYQSFLGALWSFIGPALTFLILYFIFVDRLGQQIPYFPLKLLIGITLAAFFKNIVQVTIQAVMQSQNLALASTMPAEIPLFAALTVPCLKFAVELFLSIAIAIALGFFQWKALILILPAAIFLWMLATGFGLMLGALNALARDVGEIWDALSPMLIFLTPVFYSLDMLSSWARQSLYWFNPLSSFVLSFQHALVGGDIPYFLNTTPLIGFTYGFVFFIVGLLCFRRLQKIIVEK